MTAGYGAAALAHDLHVSRETIDRLECYAALLARWQKAINLVAPGTLPDLWRRHMLDSAQLADLAPSDTRTWLDLGSGAGFPGLVIAMMWRDDRPDALVHLVESDRRKCAFLQAAAAEVGIRVVVHACRIEAAADIPTPDVISARALAPLDRILGYAAGFAGAHTRLLLPKGREVESELAAARQTWNFDATLVPSRSDPEGRIVAIEGFARV